MADVFISYAREDRDYALRLAHTLEENGFSVWWDSNLIGGSDYRAKIREALEAATKVLVLWSTKSVASAFVIDEATEAKRLRKLVPVSIDGVMPPFGFGDLHTIGFTNIAANTDQIVAALRDEDAPPYREQGRQHNSNRPRALWFAGAVAAAAALYAVFALDPLQKTASVTPAQRQASTDFTNSKRIALVVGNSKYTALPVLDNPGRDADLVAEELEKRGFKVIEVKDATTQNMTKAITEFESALSVVGGVGLFYYAGSAAYVDGDDIMLPVDAIADMTHNTIQGAVNLTKLTAEVQARITKAFKNNGTVLMYSASKGERASDGPSGQNSPFTRAFVDALTANADEIQDVFTHVAGALRPSQEDRKGGIKGPSQLRQTPWLEGNPNVKFYFNKPERDKDIGLLRILIFDSCRDNPFKQRLATR